VAPPYDIGPNPWSLLPVTDLVFIDPVSTGFSRAAPGEEPKQFHGVDEDVECMGELIRLYTSRNRRWASPKFLAGESYGTTRAAELARHLQDRHGMSVNGLVLISAILNFATARCDPGNNVAFALALPTFAAVAQHHEQAKSVALREVEDFALGPYMTTLLRGSRATARELGRAAGAVSAFTGLSRDFVERCNLRVSPGRFRKELLRATRQVVGRFDGRYTAVDPDAAAHESEHDPSNSAVQGPYTAAANDDLRRHLGYEDDLPYEVLNNKGVQPWNFGDKGRGRYLDATVALSDVMAKNHGLRVFVASGLHDLATPYFASEWALDTMAVTALDPALAPNIETRRYPGGHMMYLHQPELGALHADVRAFLDGWRP
jgi:carboxypeptidase C (cathepsin A)